MEKTLCKGQSAIQTSHILNSILICSDTRNYSCTPLGREVCNSQVLTGKVHTWYRCSFFPSCALTGIANISQHFCLLRLDPVSKPHLNTLAVIIDGVGMGNKDSYETSKACGQSISLSSLLSRLRIHMGCQTCA